MLWHSRRFQILAESALAMAQLHPRDNHLTDQWSPIQVGSPAQNACPADPAYSERLPYPLHPETLCGDSGQHKINRQIIRPVSVWRNQGIIVSFI